MISIQLIAVGKVKEAWMREGCAEYLKRLCAWSHVSIVEVDEYRLPDHPSVAQIADCIEKEGRRILEKVPKNSRLVAMCIESKQLSSEQFASWIAKSASEGAGNITFVIGGSYGLSGEVKSRAALLLSMSPMTFPHQLARVLLLEQIYRAFSINVNAKYHK